MNAFPLFTEDDVSRVLLYYPSTNASVDMSVPDFATTGNSTPTALNESTFGTGQQQRADVSYTFYRGASLNFVLTRFPECVRRNNICVPLLLARRSLHKQWPRLLPLSVLRNRRPAWLRRNILLRPCHTQPRIGFQQGFPNNLG